MAVTGDVLGSAFDGQGLSYGYVVLADGRSMTEAQAGGELTVDYVDLSVAEEDAEPAESFPGRTFRCAASRFASIEGLTSARDRRSSRMCLPARSPSPGRGR